MKFIFFVFTFFLYIQNTFAAGASFPLTIAGACTFESGPTLTCSLNIIDDSTLIFDSGPTLTCSPNIIVGSTLIFDVGSAPICDSEHKIPCICTGPVPINFIFDDKQYQQLSQKYSIFDHFPSLPIVTAADFDSVFGSEKCRRFYVSQFCQIAPDHNYFQCLTSGIYDCVTVVLQKDTKEVFACHVFRGTIFSSFESKLNTFLSYPGQVKATHFISSYTSSLMLRLFNLFQKKEITITTITRQKMNNKYMDNEYIIHEAFCLEHELPLDVGVNKIYFPRNSPVGFVSTPVNLPLSSTNLPIDFLPIVPLSVFIDSRTEEVRVGRIGGT